MEHLKDLLVLQLVVREIEVPPGPAVMPFLRLHFRLVVIYTADTREALLRRETLHRKNARQMRRALDPREERRVPCRKDVLSTVGNCPARAAWGCGDLL